MVHFFFLFLLLVAVCEVVFVKYLPYFESKNHLKFSLKTLDHYTDFQIFFVSSIFDLAQHNASIYVLCVCVCVGVCMVAYVFIYICICIGMCVDNIYI